MPRITKYKSVGHRRLDQLATFLHHVPSARFNMEVWFSGRGNLPESLENTECNSAACAAGWASILFKNDGFLLKTVQPVESEYYPVFENKNGELFTNWSAIIAFFQISQRNAENLFGADENPGAGPRQIAKKIRAFLKSKKYSKLIKALKTYEKLTR